MYHSGWSREESLDFYSSKVGGPGYMMWSRPKARMDLLEVCITLLLSFVLCSATVQGNDVADRNSLAKRAYLAGDEVGLDHRESRSLLSSSHRRHTRAADGSNPNDSRTMSADEPPPLSPNAHRKTLYKRDTSTIPSNPSEDSQLHELAKVNKEFAILTYIEKVQSSKEKCTRTHTLQDFNVSLQHTSFDKFKAQTLSVIRYANVLNSLFRGLNVPEVMYNEAFYYYYLIALLESDLSLSGATIAFDAEQFNGRAFSPNVFRNKSKAGSSGILRKNLADSIDNAYATENSPGYDWFWKQRSTNFSSLLWPHSALCKSSESTSNISNVVTTTKEGMWSAPYYSCSHGSFWMVTYSAPFFGCRQWKNEKDGKIQTTLHFK